MARGGRAAPAAPGVTSVDGHIGSHLPPSTSVPHGAMTSSGALDAATFEPHSGTEFRVTRSEVAGVPDQGVPSIRLVDVIRHPAQAGAPRADPFTLEFTGPPPALEQRIHALDHPILGAVELFLVPVGIDPDGRVRYEAVFN